VIWSIAFILAGLFPYIKCYVGMMPVGLTVLSIELAVTTTRTSSAYPGCCFELGQLWHVLRGDRERELPGIAEILQFEDSCSRQVDRVIPLLRAATLNTKRPVLDYESWVCAAASLAVRT
jgi:hypothetical protein